MMLHVYMAGHPNKVAEGCSAAQMQSTQYFVLQTCGNVKSLRNPFREEFDSKDCQTASETFHYSRLMALT